MQCNRKQQNGVGMALIEATLPLILYRKVKFIEHVIMRTSCHISIYLVSLLLRPAPFLLFFSFLMFFILYNSVCAFTLAIT